MKDYINEFNEDQKGKTFVPIKCKSVDKPPVSKPIITNKETISINEVKELATKLILEYMNLDTQLPTKDNLTEEQKTEIKQKIQEYCNRPGIMSISFRDDFKEDTAEVNALIDPTNRNNWIALREELIYKLPYSYKNALHSFTAEVWKNNRAV